jgi:colicin import membrane protein
MSLENVIAENTAALRELIAALANGLPTSAAQVAAVVKGTEVEEDTSEADAVAAAAAKKAEADKKAAAAKAAAAKKAKEEAEAAAAATQEQKDDDAAAIDLDQVIAVTLALGKAGKRAQLVELLGEFGAAKSSLLDPSDYAAFHAKATALLEG